MYKNKIYDCITFFDENLLTNLRFEILNDVVDFFIVCESNYDHKGNSKKINFSLLNDKFKDKVKHIVINDQFPDISNGWSCESFQREKIFDSLYSLTVPIYLGAPNISSHIPNNCFIDASKFTSLDELFLFCENLDDNEINLYVTNIINYLNSPEARKFSVEKFSETLLNHIKN